MRVSRWQQDARLGNVSLIPLRGNESEMRKSVAAFATDPLTVSDTSGCRGNTVFPCITHQCPLLLGMCQGSPCSGLSPCFPVLLGDTKGTPRTNMSVLCPQLLHNV